MKNDLYHFIVVDDDKASRTIVEHALRVAYPSAIISSCEDGHAALRKHRESRADIVITDYSMPSMDGARLIRELRTGDPYLPVIMISNSPNAEAEGRAAGVSAFMGKEEVLPRLAVVMHSLLPLKAS